MATTMTSDKKYKSEVNGQTHTLEEWKKSWLDELDAWGALTFHGRRSFEWSIYQYDYDLDNDDRPINRTFEKFLEDLEVKPI